VYFLVDFASLSLPHQQGKMMPQAPYSLHQGWAINFAGRALWEGCVNGGPYLLMEI